MPARTYAPRHYRLWIASAVIAVFDVVLTTLGLAYDISATMAPEDRLVSLYRDWNTRFVTGFGSQVTRNTTYHIIWVLRGVVVLLVVRLAAAHILLYGAMTEQKRWHLPYLVWNGVSMVSTVASLATFAILHNETEFSAEEYEDFHHVFLWLILSLLGLQAGYEVEVYSHFRQMLRRSRAAKLATKRRSGSDGGGAKNESQKRPVR